MRLAQHILFWILVSVFLIITFGQADGEYIKSFYFVTFLLPIAIATSYFFNYWLVPRYLLTKRYVKFSLYFFYTIVVSLYGEMIVITIAFIVLANYQYANLNPYSSNIFLLTSTLYLIVFVNAFVLLIRRYQRKEHLLTEMTEQSEKNKLEQIIVRVDRQNKPIDLQDIQIIESLSDYVKIHLIDEQVITKEKISELQSRLPDYFLRVHRSFLINRNHIDSFGKEEILIGEMIIKISRTYKNEVLSTLES
ncbi:LytR/AlgR family response regulator transcription factor [Marinoscillum sp.]|uniref:LytR/AlgR family response regulator transcription factor n=1 Tax=Marinoscillum sp. TaxID=2024838 RepID=UPI003BAB17E8